MIPADFDYFRHPGNDEDKLECLPGNGVDTLQKGLLRLEKLMPDRDLLGTMVPSKNSDSKYEYEWISIKESMKIARELAAGLTALGLLQTIKAEGKEWKFLGL